MLSRATKKHGRGGCLSRGLIMSSRTSGKQGWVLKQGLNHAKSRIRDAWKRWVLKQGLNYVAHRESRGGCVGKG